MVPVGGLEPRITRAKLCKECGYAHPGPAAETDRCEQCNTEFDGANMAFPQALLEQPTVRTSRRDRISSDEEERRQEGYHITTHVRFAPGESPRVATVRAADGSDLLIARYAPRAGLWRINHGWRRAKERNGFPIDRVTGRRGQGGEAAPDDGPDDLRQPLAGVKPFVTDSRNVLLLRPLAEVAEREKFLTTLAVALQRVIQFIYQVEEQEVAVELLGHGAHQQLLLWESAEGGTGVWERISEEREAFAQIASEALRICHFAAADEDSPAEPCSAGCYDCLLSYSNQPLHGQIDRRLVADFLKALADAELVRETSGRSYEEQYQWLRERADPASSLEREFLDYLYARRLKLPDRAQTRPAEDVPVQPDFFYDRNGIQGVCVFVDGPAHDESGQAVRDEETREALRDRGYRVVVIRFDRSLDEQTSRYPDVFGTA